ncbi:MAG: hypothetical protein JSV19_10225 [Phycisphaerales bacterium]|nr:MAG: hypothetical protein JSV19_10225 [Phycisphaerales bacterium]
MKRAWTVSMLLVGLTVLSPTAIGQQAPAKSNVAEAFAAVPADAWGAVCLRNMAEVEKKVLNIATKFGAPPMSPLMMAKEQLGLASGVNDAGNLLLVVLPSETIDAIKQNLALLVPTTDYSELTSMMQLEPVEGEGGAVSQTLLQEQMWYIAPKGNLAVVSPSLEAVKKVIDVKAGTAKALTPYQLERAGEDDLTVWVNAAAVTSAPAIAPFFAMLQAMGADAEAMKSIKAIKSLQVGLQITPAGIRLGYYSDAKEGTDVAELMASVKGTTDPLLTGLPNEAFILAFGWMPGKEISEYMAEHIGRMFDNPQLAAAPLDLEKVEQLKGKLKAMISPMRGVAVEVSALPGGPDGLIGFSKVVTVDGDARAVLTSFSELVEVIKGGLITDEQANDWLQYFEYKPGAETVDGMSVDHFVVKLDDIEDIDEEDLETVKGVIGQAGVLFRVAAADANHVVATFGGGSARLKTVADLVKSDRAPLADDVGIKNTAKALPERRYSELYLALDTLLRLLVDVGKVVDEPFPVSVPPIGAPIGAASGMVGKDGQQTDVFIPMELVLAAPDVVRTLMQGGTPPSATEPSAPAEPSAPTEPVPPPEAE